MADGESCEALRVLSELAAERREFMAGVANLRDSAADAGGLHPPVSVPSQGMPAANATAENGPDAGSADRSAIPELAVSTGSPLPPNGPATAAPPVSANASRPTSEALLQDAMRLIQSMAVVMQTTLQAPPARAERPRVKVDVPTYTGYHDRVSANEYLDRLQQYQQAMGLGDAEILERIVPVSLTDKAARWFRLVGERSRSMEDFRAKFRDEFLPANYEYHLRRELEQRTQHPDESLLEYVRAMDELYRLAEPLATNAEKVERVTRQAHPTFAAYLRGGGFRNLDELASEAKRIQGDILAARAYRPPPPAAHSLEPRCAWTGAHSARSNRTDGSVAVADEQFRDNWELSDRALHPYSYALRSAHATAERNQPRRGQHADPRPSAQPPLAPERDAPRDRGNQRQGRSNRCYRCDEPGHFVRDCRHPPPRDHGRSGNGRGRR
ncbi:uncharacterized protein LOC144175606 [Haemaphysalis longicornis]